VRDLPTRRHVPRPRDTTPARAHRLVNQYRNEIERVAQALIKTGELCVADVLAMMEGAPQRSAALGGEHRFLRTQAFDKTLGDLSPENSSRFG
jgi:hypothetical protein